MIGFKTRKHGPGGILKKWLQEGVTEFIEATLREELLRALFFIASLNCGFPKEFNHMGSFKLDR